MLDLVNSANNFEGEVSADVGCNLPYIGSCTGSDPVLRDDGYCTYTACQADLDPIERSHSFTLYSYHPKLTLCLSYASAISWITYL